MHLTDTKWPVEITPIDPIHASLEENLSPSIVSTGGLPITLYLAIPEKIKEHIEDYSNPHKVTKDQVGLDEVDNTSDIDKPVSTATQEFVNTVHDELDEKINAERSYLQSQIDSNDEDISELHDLIDEHAERLDDLELGQTYLEQTIADETIAREEAVSAEIATREAAVEAEQAARTASIEALRQSVQETTDQLQDDIEAEISERIQEITRIDQNLATVDQRLDELESGEAIVAGVSSVNGETGAVEITPEKIGAAAESGTYEDLITGEANKLTRTLLTSSDDLNNIVTEGYYHWTSSQPTNSPCTYGIMIVMYSSSTNYSKQIVFRQGSHSVSNGQYTAEEIWLRSKDALSGWTEWALIPTQKFNDNRYSEKSGVYKDLAAGKIQGTFIEPNTDLNDLIPQNNAQFTIYVCGGAAISNTLLNTPVQNINATFYLDVVKTWSSNNKFYRVIQTLYTQKGEVYTRAIDYTGGDNPTWTAWCKNVSSAGGTLTWTDGNIVLRKSDPILTLDNTNYAYNETVSANRVSRIWFRDKNYDPVGVLQFIRETNDSRIELGVIKDKNGNYGYVSLIRPDNTSNAPSYSPYPTNAIDLGSTARKWKDVYADTFHGKLDSVIADNLTLAQTISSLTTGGKNYFSYKLANYSFAIFDFTDSSDSHSVFTIPTSMLVKYNSSSTPMGFQISSTQYCVFYCVNANSASPNFYISNVKGFKALNFYLAK